MERKVRTTFRIQGELTFKEKPELKVFNSKKNDTWQGRQFQVGVKADGGYYPIRFFGGDAFLNSSHSKYAPISYTNRDGETIKVTEEDSKKKEIMEKIPMYRKRFFNDEEYIYNVAFIEAVYNSLSELNGKIVNVYGDTEFNYGSEKDAVYDGNSVTRISVVEEKEGEETPQFATGTYQLVLTEDSLDDVFTGGKIDVKKVKELGDKIGVFAYVPQQNRDAATRDDIPLLFFPKQFYIKTDKLDLENEQHVKVLNFVAGQCKGKKNKITTVGFNVKLRRGTTSVELTEEELNELLSKEEKEFIEFFPDQKERFLKQKTNSQSERVNEVHLAAPHPSLPVAEEAEDVSYEMLEFYKTIGVYSNDNKPAKAEKKEPSKPKEEPLNVTAIADEYF